MSNGEAQEKIHLQSFSYACFPLVKEVLPVECIRLIIEDEETENIRCHELQLEDNVAQLLRNFREMHAKAVLFINVEENYKIRPEFLSGVQALDFPVIVVKKSDGNEIIKCIHDYEDVYASIYTENTVVDAVTDMSQHQSTSTLAIGEPSRGIIKGHELIFFAFYNFIICNSYKNFERSWQGS